MERIPGLRKKDWDNAEHCAWFSSNYLVSRYDNPSSVPEIHKEWWALFFDPHPLVAIAAPRNHAKSTAMTFAFLLFVVCLKMYRHILLIGANEDLAGQFLLDIRVELEENEALCRDFGIRCMRKTTETEIVIEFNDGSKTRIIVKGALQRMRGLKWERKRPDLVIFDDMEDEELVMNDTRRLKFRNWFSGAVRPIGSHGAVIRGVGTIIGFDSFLERTMPPEKSKHTVVEPLRMYSTQKRAWMGVKYRGHDDDFTEFLWKERYDEEWFRQKQREFAELGQMDIYGQEYLNNPIDPTTSYFRPSDFIEMGEHDFDSRKTYYAAADFAIGENQRSAYSVIVVGAVDPDGFLHLVDVRRGRWDGLEIVDEMFSVQLRYDVAQFRVEQENIARSIGAFVYKAMADRDQYINLDPVTPTKDKDKRARSIQARMRAGRVKFDKSADWYPQFEEELLRYPKYATKDQVDAFAWLGLMLDDMVEPDTDEQIEEYEYQEAFRESRSQGRSSVTGY